MSRGRAYPITKRSSHIVLVLSDGNPASKEKNQKKAKTKVQRPKAKATAKPKDKIKK